MAVLSNLADDELIIRTSKEDFYQFAVWIRDKCEK